MIAYWQLHHRILEWFKDLNDAGIINAAAAIGTLAAVLVALLPSILTWWRRPQLRLEIPPSHFQISKTPVEGTSHVATAVSVGSTRLTSPDTVFMSASLLVRNVGVSPAAETRVVATDLYDIMPDGKAVARDMPQRRLPGGGELPGALTLRLILVNRIRVDQCDSGFRIGQITSASVTTRNMDRQIHFTPKAADIEPFGIYVVRLVTSASNARAKTHLIQMKLAKDAIILSIPMPAIKDELKAADRTRRQPLVSEGA